MKKLIIFTLVLCLLSGLFVTAQEANEVSELPAQAGLLSALGIMDEDTLSSTDALTRAELAVLLTRLMNLQSTGAQASYSDVTGFTYGAAEIAAATDLGWMSGYSDGSFHPEEAANVKDAVVSLCRMMGYGLSVEPDANYPAGYLAMAAQRGLTQGVDLNKAFDAATAARLCLNALEAEPMRQVGYGENAIFESGKSLLEAVFDVYKGRGVVSANQLTALDSGRFLPEGQAEIDGVTYTATFDVGEWIGCRVDFYYRDVQGEQELIFAELAGDMEILTIEAENISQFTDRTLWYEENEKSKSIDIPGQVDVIYNGRAYPQYTQEVFTPELGRVKLILDRGICTSAVIEDYKNYVVDSVSTQAEKIAVRYPDGAIDLAKPSWCFIQDTQGAPMELLQVKAGQVISVSASADGQVIKMTVSQNVASGRLEEIREDHKILVDGEEYRLSPNVVQCFPEELIPGDIWSYSLDYQGNIAYMKRSGDSSRQFGYIIKAEVNKSVDRVLEIQMLTAEDGIQIFTCAGSFELDGSKANREAQAILSRPQLVVYSQNLKGEICYIDTAPEEEFDDSLSAITASEGLHRNYSSGTAALHYKQTTGTFSGFSLVKEDTVAFFVSKNTEHADEKNFYAKSGAPFLNDKQYVVDCYSLDPTNPAAQAVVVYDFQDGTVDVNTTVSLVKQITQVVNENGETVSKLYILKGNKEICYQVAEGISLDQVKGEDGALYQVREGAVIRFAVNKRGEISNMTLVLDPYAPYESALKCATNPNAAYTEKFRVIYGTVYSKMEGLIQLTTKDLSDPQVVQSIRLADLENYANLERYPIYLCEIKGDEATIRTGSVSDIGGYLTEGENASKLLVNTLYGDPKNIFIYHFVD